MAKKYSKYLELVVLPLWIVSLFTFGLIFFTRGFLLVRIEIGNKSEARPYVVDGLASEKFFSAAGLNLKKDSSNGTTYFDQSWIKFNKVVLFVIDGLRYDFILHDPNLTNENTRHYQNKFVNLNEIVEKSPENARFFKFVADPPTITVQRVKGLTTGSLPTFADATSNFGNAKVPEDNLINQLSRNNRSIIMIGDEVWVDLFPNYFKRQYAYPSLDAQDLDEVDNGIREHLIPEMKKSDWNIIIAHGLGVDHCGHTFGPDHREMERKLKEMDLLVKDVIDSLDNDTILYVFGDHGMTQQGEHGGESEQETTAALMIYSKQKIFPKTSEITKDKVIAQVDLVPTISLQMGIPIPFSNIGTVIADLFVLVEDHNMKPEYGIDSEEIQRNMNKVLSIRTNAQQVMRYLDEYSKVSPDIGEKMFLQLRKIFIEAEQSFKRVQLESFGVPRSIKNTALHSYTISAMKNTQIQYREFVHQVLKTCRAMWAKFDLLSTGLGLVFMLMTLVSGLIILWNMVGRVDLAEYCSLSFIQYVGVIINIMAWVLNILLEVSAAASLSLFIFQFISLMCLMSRFWSKKKGCSQQREHFINGKLTGLAIVLFVAYLCSQSSNSFIMNENALLLGMIQILLLSRVFVHVSNAMNNSTNEGFKHYERLNSKKLQKKKEQNLKIDWHHITRAAIILVASICARVAKNFWHCHQDQIDCESSPFLQPMKSVMYKDHFMFKVRLYLAIGSVLGLIFSCYCWCKKNGHLVGNSLIYICTQVCLPICGFSILLHWALQSAYDKKLATIFDLPWIQQVFFPRVVYTAVLFILVFLIWDPLGICLIMKHRRPWHEKFLPGNTLNENIHTVFRNMRNSLNEKFLSKNQEESPPLVYGLGTVYSTAYITLTVASALVFMMLLSDGIAFSVLLLCIAAFCLVIDESFGDTSNERISKGPSLLSIITWSFISSYWFYGLGHQATIPAIRFDAAFIGRQGDSGARFIPGLLIFLNTYASQILCSLTLPLLCIWSISKHGSASNWMPTNKNISVTKNEVGEMIIRENPKDTKRIILITFFTFLILNMFKVWAISAVVAFHRRHLLIWRAFAPRFVFEAAGFLFSVPFLFASILFFIMVDSALEKWTIKLEEVSKIA